MADDAQIQQSEINVPYLQQPSGFIQQSYVDIPYIQNPHAQVQQSYVEIIYLVENPIPAGGPNTPGPGGAPGSPLPIPGFTPGFPPPVGYPFPVPPPLPIPRGQYPMKGGCPIPNRWDKLLFGAEDLLKAIRYPTSCSIPEEWRNLLPWDDEHGAIPPGSVTLNRADGIITPAPAAGDQTIVSYRVPKGYHLLLAGFYWQYSGLGFVEGSGDIIFRLKVNQWYVKGLSNETFTLGSTKFPIPMTQGQILKSDDVVSAIVNVPNLSGQIQVGASTCYAGLFGFLWPY